MKHLSAQGKEASSSQQHQSPAGAGQHEPMAEMTADVQQQPPVGDAGGGSGDRQHAEEGLQTGTTEQPEVRHNGRGTTICFLLR